ncbi:replication initiator protein [Peromfec virus RodF7_14]|uniref:Replication initiator protein n=1 Tax=Peromfec virus RodF7_14 TaxID=2929349 RepID=A0A976N2F3_9VIRU|nr:replication initiator protein [Peromfec virus RodF7_14]
MRCLTPVDIDIYPDNPLYQMYRDEGISKISVPCGKCAACRNARSTEWSIRLKDEWHNSQSALFVTLTYNDESLPIGQVCDSFGHSRFVPVLNMDDISAFIKRLRDRIRYRFGKAASDKIRFYFGGEYGPTTLRPHYHGIIFNLPLENQDLSRKDYEIITQIEKSWSNGFIRVEPVKDGCVNYITKYMLAASYYPEYLPVPCPRMSRRPGIGACYLEKSERIDWYKRTMSNYYPLPNGVKCRLPRYYKDKIFSESEKELLSQLDLARKQDFEAYLDNLRRVEPEAFKAYIKNEELKRFNFLRKFEKHVKTRKDL